MKKTDFEKLHFGLFKTPKGWCAAAWTLKGLSALILPRKSKTLAFRGLRKFLPLVPSMGWPRTFSIVPKVIQQQTLLALNGKPYKLPRFDIHFLTAFQQRILKTALKIPQGQVRTYGWVARKAGSPRGFRAAGQALTRNPIPIFIPCHRVVAADGSLGGFSAGLHWKRRLLALEAGSKT